MTQKEAIRLTDLAKQLFPRYKREITQETALAWFYAFEPFDYETVKAALLDYVRRSDFFPAPSELMAAMPVKHDAPRSDMTAEIAACVTEQHDRAEAIRAALRAQGKRTAVEAKLAGVEIRDYIEEVTR